MDPKVPIIVLISFFFQGCCGPQCQFDRIINANNGGGDGGGTDAIVADMPFPAGYQALCAQGAGGSYSHTYTSTKYDLDLDTPNNRDDLVFAPMSGTAYVHDDGSHGFGRHVNLDLHDGTYLLMGHMKSIFIEDGMDVAAGQILGFEGTTGASTGDHVHFGRHSGDAKKPADYGASLSGLKMKALDLTTGQDVEVMTSDAVCGLSTGHVYQSELPTAKWHPRGSLLKSPSAATVYRVGEAGVLQEFLTEEAFTSLGYDFRDVVLVSDEELACYSGQEMVGQPSHVSALRDSANQAWILLGTATDPERERFGVRADGAVGVLSSYGIRASSFDDIDRGSDTEIAQYPNMGWAGYRDGALISEEGQSAVYVMSGGFALPIRDWDTFLLLGFVNRAIIRVPADEFALLVTGQGNCGTDIYCIDHNNVTECGHSEEVNREQEVNEDSGQALPAGTDSGDGQDSALDGETFMLRWTTPGNLVADWITVAGTWTYSSGAVTSWDPMLAGVHDANSVRYDELWVNHGDKFRFSMAYGLGSAESWSCLAPFPPGRTQGSLDVYANGQPVPWYTVADPNSAGCQIELVIP